MKYYSFLFCFADSFWCRDYVDFMAEMILSSVLRVLFFTILI